MQRGREPNWGLEYFEALGERGWEREGMFRDG